jgi:glutamate--cysteine ligase
MSRQVAEDTTPIEEPRQLLDYLLAGAKPPSRWGHGIEYERIGVFTASGETVPFSGQQSVEAVLKAMAQQHGWTPLEENGHVVEVSHGDLALTLEPGAQLEFVGPVHFHIDSLNEELCKVMRQVDAVSAPLGISWLAMGVNPFTPVESIGWIPKSRYGIMSRRLGRRGKLAHYMMKATAGIQGNFDFSSGEDAMAKLRLAMATTSLLTALLANSPLYVGRPNRFHTMRAFIWLDTDPDRCGLLKLAFRDDLDLQTYVDYALAIPMLFIVRDGKWIDMDGYTFRRFMDEGRESWHATVSDWALHLTTIFPEVRLKQYMEVRGADSVPPDLAVAMMACWKGLLYGPRAAEEAWRLMADLSWAQRQQLHRDVCTSGLEASVKGTPVTELARQLLEIARQGLKEQETDQRNAEAPYLEPLFALLGPPPASPAARLEKLWKDPWEGDREQLVEYGSRITLDCDQ